MEEQQEKAMKRTCLYDNHVELGALISPFGGFLMPIQYTDITREHLAVRNEVGMFDVSHMGEIFVSGPDAEKYINHIFTNDISVCKEGQVIYGMMLYPDGGVVDDLLVYKEFSEDHFLLVVNASNIDKDHSWILQQAKGYDVQIVNASNSWGQIAIQGPLAEKTVLEVMGLKSAERLSFYEFCYDLWNDNSVIVSRTGYTGEDGFEIYLNKKDTVKLWNLLLKAGVEPCGLGCRDTLRFEAGMPLYGDELSENISPVMAGLGMFCAMNKDEFIGREAIAEQMKNGTARKLVGIEIEDRAVPRAGYAVEDENGKEVGIVTTGYHSISLDKSICFALVDIDLSKLDTPLYIRIRRKVFPGKVVGKRFYKTKYKK